MLLHLLRQCYTFNTNILQMMLMQESLVRKCLLNLRRKFIFCTKESHPIRKLDPEMKGVERLQVKWLEKILASSCAWSLLQRMIQGS